MAGFFRQGGLRPLAGLMLVILLVAGIALETYYVLVLRQRIEAQTDELRSLSVQLQSSRSESDELREELSSIKKLTGEKKDGNTADRQH